jgi:hypothetical protein
MPDTSEFRLSDYVDKLTPTQRLIQKLVSPRHQCDPFSDCGVWLCPRCLTFRPWCFGCDSEEWPDLCDDCWFAIERLGEEPGYEQKTEHSKLA